MQEPENPERTEADRIAMLAGEMVRRIYDEGHAVERIEIQFATDGLYLVTLTERGMPSGPQLPVPRVGGTSP